MVGVNGGREDKEWKKVKRNREDDGGQGMREEGSGSRRGKRGSGGKEIRGRKKEKGNWRRRGERRRRM